MLILITKLFKHHAHAAFHTVIRRSDMAREYVFVYVCVYIYIYVYVYTHKTYIIACVCILYVS